MTRLELDSRCLISNQWLPRHGGVMTTELILDPTSGSVPWKILHHLMRFQFPQWAPKNSNSHIHLEAVYTAPASQPTMKLFGSFSYKIGGRPVAFQGAAVITWKSKHIGETGRAAAFVPPLDLLYSNSITFMSYIYIGRHDKLWQSGIRVTTWVGSVSMSRLQEQSFPSVDAVTKLFELATPTTW